MTLKVLAKRLRHAQPDSSLYAIGVVVTLSLAKGHYNASYS